MEQKIFLTGENGMLGSCINKRLKNILIPNQKIDITNKKIIQDYLESIKPDIIIHTAAVTDVELCEKNKDLAYQVNSKGTKFLAEYCVGKETLFIYLSSTGIYGNHKNTRYDESDKVIPTTIHHRTKYKGELYVQKYCKNYLILRTGWLYGGNRNSSKNFVAKRIIEGQNSEIIYSNTQQKGNPTYTEDLIDQIIVLIENKCVGIFNCVNEATEVTRYDYVKHIIQYAGLDTQVMETSKNSFNRIARVSNNESAINKNLNRLGLNVMGHWKKSLEKYIDTQYN